MISRIIELAQKGGPREVRRGAVDWYKYNVKRRVVLSHKEVHKIETGDVHIDWALENKESASRALGLSEQAVMDDFAETVRCGEVFWDVGANQGAYALVAAKSGLHVHAFEPGKGAAAILQKNARLNNLEVELHRIALDSESGEKFLTSTGRTGNRTVNDSGDGEKISVKRGDEVDAPQPDILKIDVEGLEMRVLTGLDSVLDDTRICYVEIHDDEELKPIKETLQGHGFTSFCQFRDGEVIIKCLSE